VSTILVAEDDAPGRELLVILLGFAGHRVLQARDGAEALTITRQEHPDLVIADVLMPTMDGYEFVRQLRAEVQVADTPVVFYTAAYHEREARVLAEQCGVLHVLTKPTERARLLQVVRTVLNIEQPPLAATPPVDFQQEHLRLVSNRLVRNTHELEALNARLAGLIELGLQLAAEEDPPGLLDAACRGARKLLAAASAVVELETGDDGVRQPGLDTYRPGAALRVALASPSHQYGWIVVQGKFGGGEFSVDDQHVLGLLAGQLALAYENAQRARSLAAAIRARDEFLSIAAHELKTPVTSMIGYAQLLLADFGVGESMDMERHRRGLRTVEQQSAKLSRLVSQLVDVASLDAGKLRVQHMRLEISGLVHTAVAAADIRTHEVIERPTDQAFVMGDPTRLHQVLLNLLQNAERYSPPGTEIEVDVRHEADIEIAIRDHGPGIAIEQRAYIFDRYFQAQAGNYTSGMGLDLCICRQLVELQGGRIRAEFPIDGGCRFVISLPAQA
jgi:signal transduction histidine kinase/CheY-like chemotaxis protein